MFKGMMAAVCVLVFAGGSSADVTMNEPTTRPATQPEASADRAGNHSREADAVILIDGTLSMARRSGETTAFECAKGEATRLLDRLPGSTVVRVVYLGDSPRLVGDRSEDAAGTAWEIGVLQQAWATGSMAKALELAAAPLSGRGRGRAALYVFSCFDAESGRAISTPHSDASRAMLEEMGKRFDVHCVEVGAPVKWNYAVTSLRRGRPAPTIDFPVEFQVTVKVQGDAADAPAPKVSLFVNGKEVESRALAIGKTGRETLLFTHKLNGPGESLVEARVSGDRFEPDNRRLLLCSAPAARRVLIVDDSPGGKPGDRASFFVTVALNPVRPGEPDASPFSGKVIKPDELTPENMAGASAVVMAGVGGVDEALAKRLEAFVREGGAVWLFVGDRVKPDLYNKLLYRDGKGLLPARLGKIEHVTPEQDREKPVRIKLRDVSHPAFSEFKEMLGRSDNIRVMAYFELGDLPEDDQNTRVAIRMTNGRPFLVEKRLGRGRVFLTTSSCDASWNVLVTRVAFLPLLCLGLDYIIGDPDKAVNLDIGDRFIQEVRVGTVPMLLRRPDGTTARINPMKVGDAGESWVIRYGDTDTPGLYELDVAPVRVERRRFVVNFKAAE
ncbi:MAG: hypothetical protein BIFFINMI_02187 [Phycisphaerae bacterium]|nr:hypothetical protein [Phycisphaerae bacterium]